MGERAILFLFCRRCAGIFRTPVIVALCPDDCGRTVGRNLRRHRKEQGFSQEAVADRMGVHGTHFSSDERGERNLTLQTLEKIAHFLGVDPRTLLHE